MGAAVRELGRRGLALLVLLLAGYLLFKLVLGFATGLAWLVLVVVAIAGVVWALRTL